MADIIAVLRANTSDFTAKMAEAKGEVSDLGNKGSSSMSKLATIGKAAFLGLAAGAAGVAVASIDLADKYQTTTNTIAANGDISVAAADKIGKAFLGTAGTTIFSAQNIATAFGSVAGQVKLMNGGVLNSAAAMKVMGPAMDLAEASGTSLNNTTSDITTTLQAFGLKITQSPLVANVLFNAARDTGTSVDSLSSTIDKARAKMGSAAPSVQQMGGLIVDLANHGETGRAAMSALGSAFTGIITPTAAVTKAQQAMGLSFINAQGQLDPLQQIIGAVGPKIAGMGNAQATATLKSLGFGSAATKLLGVFQAGPAAFDKATAAVARTNSAHDAAEKQAGTLQHQVETLKAAAEDYGVKIGQVIVPMLEKFIKVTMSVIEWLGKHKIVLIALGVVIGGVLLVAIAAWTAGIIAAGLASLAAIAPATAFGAAMTGAALALDASLGPILLVIAGIALLVVAVIEIVKHWSVIEGFFKRLWDDVKKVFDAAFDFIKSHLRDFVEALLIITTVGVALIPVMLVRYWSQISSDVHTAWSDIINFFTGIPAKILDALSALSGLLMGWITTVWDTFKSWVLAAWNTEIAFWTTLPQKIINAVVSLGSLLLSWIQTAWNNFRSWIEGAWNNEVAFWSGLPGKIISAVSGFASMFVNWIKSAWTSFSNAVLAAWSTVSSWFSGLPKKIISALGDLGTLLLSAGKDIIQGLINGIKSMAGAVADAVKKIAGDAVGAVKSVLGIFSPSKVFHDLGMNVMQGWANGITAHGGLVTSALSSVAGSLTANASLGVNSGITPITGGSGTSSNSGGNGPSLAATVVVNVGDVQLVQMLQTVITQYQRGSSVPVFGTTQTVG